MNTFLWILQIILCIKFLSVAYAHGVRQDKTEMQEGIQRLGPLARPLLFLVALCSLLVSAALVLPGAFGFLPWLTPWSAAILAVMNLLSILLHVRSREKPKIFANLILFVMAAFLAYGRWVLVPL